MQKKQSPLLKLFLLNFITPRVIKKKKQYPVFLLVKNPLYCQKKQEQGSGASWCLRGYTDLAQTPSEDDAPQWGRLTAEFSSVWALHGPAPDWEVRKSLFHTRDVHRPDLLLGMSYVQYCLSVYLHWALLLEQIFSSRFQTKRQAHWHCLKLMFPWKGFLRGKDCLTAWCAHSPF